MRANQVIVELRAMLADAIRLHRFERLRAVAATSPVCLTWPTRSDAEVHAQHVFFDGSVNEEVKHLRRLVRERCAPPRDTTMRPGCRLTHHRSEIRAARTEEELRAVTFQESRCGRGPARMPGGAVRARAARPC